MNPLLLKVDGEAVLAQPGDTVASALLRAGITTFTRSIKYHRPRGPFCLDGSCGQCLIRVDGVPSVQACRAPVQAGMRCERQNAPLGSVEGDVFRAVDFLFPGGLDHHHLATFSRLAGQVALEVARRLAGLGHLPDRAQAAIPARAVEVRVAIVGAGVAGLAAARAAAEQGEGVVLIERSAVVGGAARLQLDDSVGFQIIESLATAARAAGAQIWCQAECIGLYPPEEGGPALVAVLTQEGLVVVRASKVVVACGGVSQPLAFPGGDRPGVYAARGLLQLADRHAVLAGAPRTGAGPNAPDRAPRRLAVVGEGRELALCAAALGRRGYQIAAVVEADRAVRARGNPVRELQHRAADGSVEKVRCDAIAVALPQAPLHELASAAGAPAKFDAALGGFAVEADDRGRTALPWLLVAGRVAGRTGAAALESGRAAGEEAGHG